MSESVDPAPPAGPAESEEREERIRPVVTRRDFLAGAGVGVAATAAVAGGAFVVARPGGPPVPMPAVQPAPGAPAVIVPPVAPGAPVGAPQLAPAAKPAAAPAQAQALPLSMRRVELNIDGQMHTAIVDVRESLWETMVYKLGLTGANLGCDRAQCGACTVVVDGHAVNGCTVLSARLGRGQKILTVEGIRTGPGVEGLHPVQRAYWREGGYQCGICTRGFIMSTYALLQVNKSPTNEEIAEALSGNICRCSEYPQIYASVRTAAAELRGELKTNVGPGRTGLGGPLEDPSAAH